MIQHAGRYRKSYPDKLPAIKLYQPTELNNNCPQCSATGQYKNKNKFGMTRMTCKSCNVTWIL